MPRGKKPSGTATPVETFVHTKEQRTNIPTAELETFMRDEDRASKTGTYPSRSQLLYPRDPVGDPQLVWWGKDEQDSHPLEVTAPPIYIQEKVHPKAIIEDLRNQKKGEAPAQAVLFDDFNGIVFEDLVEFYQHEQNWSNRLILGDALEVMSSLAEREGLKGKVQCVYLDPPYGIKFGSNWQVSTRKVDVKDGKAEDVSRQPEMVAAFRDTWQLGIHSYLSYLRSRLILVRELLASSGSCFVQIGAENAHLVRAVLDEVFGVANFVSQIAYQKTSGAGSFAGGTNVLSSVADYILWYARDIETVKYRQLYRTKGFEGFVPSAYRLVELEDGARRTATPDERAGNMPPGARLMALDNLVSQTTRTGQTTVFPVDFNGRQYMPKGGGWKTNRSGMDRLRAAKRLDATEHRLGYVRYLDDFGAISLNNVWTDVVSSFMADKTYVVQTNVRVPERCLLMTTDPGDLILDPTCGSGTTAFVAEQWGRRWITIDTSRVALTLARQRLMAARFPSYILADTSGKDLRRGFVYKTIPHVTLKSIANNPDIREGMSRSQVDSAIASRVEQEVLYDQPAVEKSVVRVTGPFTVESLSASVGVPTTAESQDRVPTLDASSDFVNWIIANLRVAGVQNSIRKERLTFGRLEPWPGEYIHAVGEYLEDGKPRRAAITIGPQYGTIEADLVRDAAKEAAGFFDLLILCGFAFDAYITAEFRQLGNLTILKANMNPDLSMGGDLLKKTGTGNLFTVFGEPDIDLRIDNDRLVVEIRGLDVYDPTTGQIRSHTTADIACWFIDTAYNGNSFFVRHAYFIGAGDPYRALRAALRAEIDEDAWASLYSTVSRPFEAPASGRIAVKVINHYGDEVVKVYVLADAKVLRLPQRRYEEMISAAELLVADEAFEED